MIHWTQAVARNKNRCGDSLQQAGSAFLIALLTGSLMWAARVTGITDVAEPTSNTNTSELVAQGQTLFFKNCSGCHGKDAKGDEGPDLHGLKISNEKITATITKGVKGEMPNFSKKLNPTQVAALVAYLRKLDAQSE